MTDGEAMTDQPSTQEGDEDDELWQGALQHMLEHADDDPAPTTQEAEKALETIEAKAEWLRTLEAAGPYSRPNVSSADIAVAAVAILDALRSLRTQHTEMQVELEQAYHDRTELEEGVRNNFERIDALEAQHTKDQARIADLERVLANLGQLTAGGSGDAAGSEVE